MAKVVAAVSFHGALPPTPGKSGGDGIPPRVSGWQSVADPSDYLVLLGDENDLPPGAYLAVGHATATPGYGDDARGRLEDILATFVQVEGYEGHPQGHNETVEEEAWTFVFG